jgi:hypothetical protein
VKARVFSVLCAAIAFTASVPSCRTAGLKQAYTALDSEGNRKRSTFFTDSQSIYCIGELVSARADVTLSGVIRSTRRYDAAGQLVPVEDVYTSDELAPGKTKDTIAAFTMNKVPVAENSTSSVSPDALPFPAGDYVCDLSIDGEHEETVSFSIVYPDCPTVPAAPTIPCRGWVKQGSQCPAETPNTTCTCASSGLWECSP